MTIQNLFSESFLTGALPEKQFDRFLGGRKRRFRPLKSTFWPFLTGCSSSLTPDSSLKWNSSSRKYIKHSILPLFEKKPKFHGNLIIPTKNENQKKIRNFQNLGKNKSFRYFLGLEFYFELESGVKIELNPVEKDRNVDFRLKMVPNTLKTV